MRSTTVAVATDGSETATEAVRMAAEVTRRFDANLVLLSAFQDKGGTDRSSDLSELQWASNPLARTREILARTEEEVLAMASIAAHSSTRAIPSTSSCASRWSAVRTCL